MLKFFGIVLIAIVSLTGVLAQEIDPQILVNLESNTTAYIWVRLYDNSGIEDYGEKKAWYENISTQIIEKVSRSDYIYLKSSSDGFSGIVNRSGLDSIVNDPRVMRVIDDSPQVVVGFPEASPEPENEWYKDFNGTLVAREVLRQIVLGKAEIFVQLKNMETPDEIIESLGDEFVLDDATRGYFSGTITEIGLIKLIETTRVWSIDPDTTFHTMEEETIAEKNASIVNESNVTSELAIKEIEGDAENPQYGWILILGGLAVFIGVIYLLSRIKKID